MEYFIYHIPGIKIGCSTEPHKRISNQGFSNFEIIEKHEDIIIASQREIELQEQYGYQVDKIPYNQTISNRRSFNKGHSYGKNGNQLKEMQSLGGLSSSSKTEVCPHCGQSQKVPIVYRWHFNNCKKKGPTN